MAIEGMQIGENIRTKGWWTLVPKFCHSTCVLIWLAGVNRVMAPDAKIGFHAISVNGKEAGSGNALAGSYLTRLGYSYEAVAAAAARDQRRAERQAEAIRGASAAREAQGRKLAEAVMEAHPDRGGSGGEALDQAVEALRAHRQRRRHSRARPNRSQ